VKEALRSITDMTGREKAIFAPLIAATLILGVYPKLATDLFAPTVSALVETHQARKAEAAAASDLAMN
jgi:NADH-quinone oxidoreductase subunit M